MAQTATKTTPAHSLHEHNAHNDTENLKEQIAALRSDLSTLTELVGEIGKSRGREAKRHVEARVHEARDRGEEALRDAGAKMAELEADARGSIRDNPFQAIGIAAAIGFAIGFLGRR